MELTKYRRCWGFNAFCNFNTKVYIPFENTIRAAYLTKVEFHLNQMDNRSVEVVEYYNVAGLGLQRFKNGGKIYLNIQSFKEGKTGLAEGQVYPKTDYNGVPCNSYFYDECLEYMFHGKVKVKLHDNYFLLYRYRWNGIAAEKVNVECTTITLTEDGWTTDAKYPENTFFSKRECEMANQISVIEFD